ncbi:DUF5723 family protein [Ochrovirga pacifica]|uniref:DUF5723 family protein n=1 Tax=Ochrovirga pacifica TaxID=1042376 RepID=UPI00025591D0|nr:DUF5723 family protein [Ochrovirga pacifica]
MKNTIKLIALMANTVFTSHSVCAQNSQVSLFHLGDYVLQTTNISPVYIPKNSFSLGLPGLGGVGAQLSNGFTASDLLKEVPGTNRLEYDFLNTYNTIKGDYNTLSQTANVTLLNLAFKRKKGSISFFINARENVNWQMSKKGLIHLMANGLTQESNGIFIDDQLNTTAYIESGVGFTQQFFNNKLAVGIRIKSLIGLANGSTQNNAFASIQVNDDYTWTINTRNAVARVTGIQLADNNEFEFTTDNTGLGFDIGATYEIIPNLNLEVAVNDIGSITWKKGVKEYYIEDTQNLIVDGVDLKTDDDILDKLEDELDEDLEMGEREGKSYTTKLATNSYASLSYLLASKHLFRATMFNKHTIKNTESVIALGYNIALDKTTYGIVGIKNAQGNLDFGFNLATKLGPLQLYLVSDNVNQIFAKPEDAQNINLQFGINLVFGYNKWLNAN